MCVVTGQLFPHLFCVPINLSFLLYVPLLFFLAGVSTKRSRTQNVNLKRKSHKNIKTPHVVKPAYELT
jgi:hypothetical protein